VDLSSSGTSVAWSISGPTVDGAAFAFSGTGSSVSVKFTTVGSYTIDVTLTAKGKDHTYSTTAMNK
jgi:hypothetical protein